MRTLIFPRYDSGATSAHRQTSSILSMNDYHSRMAAESICFAAERVKDRMIEYISTMDRPSNILRPTLNIDGDRWCALYGKDLQQGVAGFGKSPAEAYNDFDKAWWETLPEVKP